MFFSVNCHVEQYNAILVMVTAAKLFLQILLRRSNHESFPLKYFVQYSMIVPLLAFILNFNHVIAF